MQDVTRFTTEFVADEDRIRVALEGKGGRVRLVWLTRRMLMLLLPRLIDAFGSSDAAPERIAARHQAQQGFSQQAAVSAIQRQQPVRAATPDIPREPDLLAWGVDVQKDPKQVLLVFKSKDGTQSQPLPFSPAALRQWLAVLHGQFAKAEWDAPFWPAWITAKAPQDVVAKLN